MSNLLVQNIKHTNNTSAQTIDSSGRTTAVLNNDTTYRSDSGAVTQNLVQGLCKAWGNLDGSGTISTRDSFNIASASDEGTGIYDFNYTNNMSNDDYSAQESVNETSGKQGHLNRIPAIDDITTSDIRFGCTYEGTNRDVDELYVTINGDLA
tara:strand:+ start:159 stop:614 length:456 start_codon:yes stop_codon:yes gene_type:complete